MKTNRLFKADCIDIIHKMPKGSIDLIYMDPPFNSGKNYGEFNDKWESMARYTSFLRERIAILRSLLKSTGSFYLHCDPSASHYIKVMLDQIFGIKNFRNEIIWSYRRWNIANKDFARTHDVILRYSKDKEWTWNQQYEKLAPSTLKAHGTGKRITKGSKAFQTGEESLGACMRDVWSLPVIASQSKERTGYPTQKPLKLLGRIIKASSNEGDIVLDPMCGSGTTLVAAKKLGRKYLGIDINPQALTIASNRLNKVQTGQKRLF